MINWLVNSSLPLLFPKHAHIEVQALWNQRYSLKLVDGILYRQWKDLPNGGVNAKLQLVIPQHLIPDVESSARQPNGWPFRNSQNIGEITAAILLGQAA